MKLKDAPAFLSQRLTRENVVRNATSFAANYKKNHFDTGSFAPLKHMMIGTFCIAYTVAWPTEYAHWKHEQEAKHGGGHAKH